MRSSPEGGEMGREARFPLEEKTIPGKEKKRRTSAIISTSKRVVLQVDDFFNWSARGAFFLILKGGRKRGWRGKN